MIPLGLSLLEQLELPFPRTFLFALIQSFLFGEVKFLTLFLYPLLRSFNIILFLSALFLLAFPVSQNVFLLLIDLYQKGKPILDVSVRGSPSIIGGVILIVLISLVKEKKGILPLLILLLTLISPLPHPFAETAFLDVGQGDAILIRSSMSSSNVLIDTGPPYAYFMLRKELFSRGIYTIDSLIITHDDADHNGNLDRLKQDFTIKEVITEGRDISIGEIVLDHLPAGTFDNDNDNSLIYRMRMNETDFLFTGDISKTAESVLIRLYDLSETDVLKVSHHGSYTGSSESFIAHTMPDTAIISTSGMYGHPHYKTRNTLKRYRVEVLTTKEKGTVRYLFFRYATLRTCAGEFAIIR